MIFLIWLTLRSQTDSAELQRFIDDLGDLVAYTVARKSLHAIAD